MIKGAHGKFYFIAKKKGKRISRQKYSMCHSCYFWVIGIGEGFGIKLYLWVLINYPTVLITSFPSISTSSFFNPPTVFSPAIFSQLTLSNLSL